ncbi:hypothetical protein BCV70DRAFT_237088 [Testicularia cyperi]|uniref:Fork-head domain-containing protein n=1 Tax=Testicularia cyperi TaxID=1882483 RepID=A0A317XRN3_9BASI|nr:hypothetical protein BCV70DRAFT_237088 [Testicularia cyperi]
MSLLASHVPALHRHHHMYRRPSVSMPASIDESPSRMCAPLPTCTSSRSSFRSSLPVLSPQTAPVSPASSPLRSPSPLPSEIYRRSSDHHLGLSSFTEGFVSRPSLGISLSYDPSTAHIRRPEERFRSKWARSQYYQTIWNALESGDASARPNLAYVELIKLCILKSPDLKLTILQLYNDLESKFPFFAEQSNSKGWKNTVRHNLSTQAYFVKLERERGQIGKGHYWTYCPDMEKPTSLAQSSVISISSLLPGHARPHLPVPPVYLPSHPDPHSLEVVHGHEWWTQRSRSLPNVSTRRLDMVPHSGPRAITLQPFSPQIASRQRLIPEHARRRERDLLLTPSSSTPQTTSSSASPTGQAAEAVGLGVATSTPTRTRSHTVSGAAESHRRLAKLTLDSPNAPNRSLGDYFLSHPISSRKRRSLSPDLHRDRRDQSPY